MMTGWIRRNRRWLLPAAVGWMTATVAGGVLAQTPVVGPSFEVVDD